jgi:S-(hydroxymethyl)glutathione dehydrogenase/alcohol dehydrogenase
MRAAVLEALNAPLVLGDLEVPNLEVGQVLVCIHASGICGAQLGEIAGVKGADKFLPHLMGHEGGGVVVDVGPGVTHVQNGDHVVLHWRKGTGIHSQTPKYKWDGRIVNAGWVTTFNDHAIVSENRVTPIPKDVSFEVAALMGCAITTALGLINNDAKLKIGESIAVLGCGGVGLNVIQAAAMVSADPIIAIDIKPEKLRVASTFGATHTIDSGNTDVRHEIRKIVGAKGVDVFVDTTGIVRLIEMAYELTAAIVGRTILVGVPRHDEDITIHSLPLHFGKILTGCEGGGTYPTTDIPRYLNLYHRGKLEVDRFITHRFTLPEINQALEAVRSGDACRCIVNME